MLPLVLRELFTPSNPRGIRYSFDKNGNTDDPNRQCTRWIYFFMGYAAAGVFTRFYTRLLRELFYSAGESNITLVLYILALSGAEGYVEIELLPPFKIDDSPFASILLWILQSLLIAAMMRYFGPFDAVDILLYYLLIRQTRETHVNLKELMQMCKERITQARLMRDRDFAEEVTTQMTVPFIKFGAAVGAVLQLYVSLKYTISLGAFFVACRLIFMALTGR